MVYAPFKQRPSAHMNFIARGANAMSLGPALRAALRQIDPQQPVFGLRTLAEMRGQTLATRRFALVLLGALSTLALILAAVGIYSLMSYTVTQRTSEIGIRMALGAGTRDVFRLIVGNALRLVAVGVGVGIVAALVATRVLASLLYGVAATDPSTFVGICALIAGVALVASWLPARRATKVDPLVAIRYD
jgi:putative ABC transport system permease protein